MSKIKVKQVKSGIKKPQDQKKDLGSSWIEKNRTGS